MSEHPVDQPIIQLTPSSGETGYLVGHNCTRIEATTKSGLHSNIPYLRVWDGDSCICEYCQHHIFAVHFAQPGDEL